MSKSQFFEPYVGKRYAEGINGKQILVLGASFYCDRVKCPFFASCTSVILKDSSAFDTKCPEYQPAGKKLHLEPSYCVEDAPVTYQRFAAYMGKHLGTDGFLLNDLIPFVNFYIIHAIEVSLSTLKPEYQVSGSMTTFLKWGYIGLGILGIIFEIAEIEDDATLILALFYVAFIIIQVIWARQLSQKWTNLSSWHKKTADLLRNYVILIKQQQNETNYYCIKCTMYISVLFLFCTFGTNSR